MISAGLFDITPRPPLDAYSSKTVDLTLGPVLRIFKRPTVGTKQAIDPAGPNFNVMALLNELTPEIAKALSIGRASVYRALDA